MKRAFLVICIVIMTFSLASCTNPVENSNVHDTEKNNTQEVAQADDKEKDSTAEEVEQMKVFAKGFSGADGIVVDYLGNVYVGNRNTNILSKVDKDGTVNDFVKLPCKELLCMTVDKNNNIYAAGQNKLFNITKDGEITELASDFTCADDVRLDNKGNIFVTDSFENRVYKITPDLEKSIFIDNNKDEALSAQTWYITGITFDPDYKNLYLARMEEGQIVKYSINPDGTVGTSEIIAKDLPEPDHLEMDAKGNLYITIFREGSLIKIAPDGKITSICEKKFGFATGIAFGKPGFEEESVFIADYRRNIVYKIDVGEKPPNW